MGADPDRGVLAFLGGGPWAKAAHGVLREHLLGAGEGRLAVVLPTAAAYERPDRAADDATDALSQLGLEAVVVPVLRRTDAANAAHADAIREAAIVVLVDGSALHLRAVLKDTRVFEAVTDAVRRGAMLAAAGAGCSVLCDPMLDPRGGAYTVGLGLLRDVTVFPHFDSAPTHLRERSIDLLPAGVVLVGVDDATALVRERDGTWRAHGDGAVTVYLAASGEAQRYHDEGVEVLPA